MRPVRRTARDGGPHPRERHASQPGLRRAQGRADPHAREELLGPDGRAPCPAAVRRPEWDRAARGYGAAQTRGAGAVVPLDVFLPPARLDPAPAGGGHLPGQRAGEEGRRAPAEGTTSSHGGRSARASSRDSRHGAEPTSMLYVFIFGLSNTETEQLRMEQQYGHAVSIVNTAYLCATTEQ